MRHCAHGFCILAVASHSRDVGGTAPPRALNGQSNVAIPRRPTNTATTQPAGLRGIKSQYYNSAVQYAYPDNYR